MNMHEPGRFDLLVRLVTCSSDVDFLVWTVQYSLDYLVILVCSFRNSFKVKGPLLTAGKAEYQRFTIRSGLLTSISICSAAELAAAHCPNDLDLNDDGDDILSSKCIKPASAFVYAM